MKKVLLSLLFVFGLSIVIACVASCDMSEIVDSESLSKPKSTALDTLGEDNIIAFTMAGDTSTKALDVTTANMTAFEVTAFNHGTTTNPYINAVAFTGGSGTFASDTPHYWPSSGPLDFYAWSVGSATGQVVKNSYNSFTVTPASNHAQQADLVFACANNSTKAGASGGVIPLAFAKTMSRVSVKVKNTSSDYKFQVAGWKVGYVATTGTFTYSGSGTSEGTQLPSSMWSGNTTRSADRSYSSTFSTVNVAANALTPMTLAGEMVLVPQSGAAATGYASASTGAALNGSYVAIRMDIRKALDDSVVQAETWAIWPTEVSWEPGKGYVYTVDLAGGGYFESNQEGTDAELDAVFGEKMAEPDPVYTFAGLQIAPAPLYHNGTSFIIKDDDWNHDSYKSIYGAVEGSYYFNWDECHAVSDILYGGYNDWRMPSQAEWAAVTTDSRTGSTINGTAGCRYTLIQLTGVTHAGNNSPIGLLLAPDGETMTSMSKVFTWNVNDTSGNTGITAAQLDEYLDAGCVFLPSSGYFYGGSWNSAGADGRNWSSTERSSTNSYYLRFYSSNVRPSNNCNKASYYFPCRLVREAE